MALTTYADLKTSIAAWIARDDLTSIIPDFVSLAESDIRLDVRCQAMEEITTGTLTGETLAIPTGFLEAKRFVVQDNLYTYVTQERYQAYDDSSAYVWTLIGDSIYVCDGTSGWSYSLIYYKAFTALSGASDTNWLLTNHPEIYLASACKHASFYLMDDNAAGAFAARYAAAVQRLKIQQQKQRFPGALLVRAA